MTSAFYLKSLPFNLRLLEPVEMNMETGVISNENAFYPSEQKST